MSFTHLHLHTEYSLLDGACRIPKLVERIKALGMTSCAITDHGVMYGCIDFYSAMKDAGIKPIIGCEVYVCRDRLDKSAANREYSHLILLCENNTGYQNLMKLVSEGFLTGYYYRPRIDYNLIRQHSEGLICLSACLSGDLPKLLLQGRYDDAEAYVREMQDIFGEKNFYVEIMDHGIREEKIVMPRLISLAREMNVPFIDLDWYIEERFHKSIRELFTERGEASFRELERNMLHEVGEFEDVVVSTGGGTPCFFDNMEYMNGCGQTVFLDVHPDILFRRLRVAKQQRPILQGKTDEDLRTFIVEALDKREPFYSQARYRFDAGYLESRSQISESVQRLRQLLGL